MTSRSVRIEEKTGFLVIFSCQPYHRTDQFVFVLSVSVCPKLLTVKYLMNFKRSRSALCRYIKYQVSICRYGKVWYCVCQTDIADS